MSTSIRRIKMRRGVAASNPTEVPLAGEFNYETDTKNLSIGDGATAREDLPVKLERLPDEPMVENRVLLGGAANNRVKSSPALRSDGAGKLTVGEAGVTQGEIVFENATSGSITERAVTGALGTRVQTRPARDGQVAIGALFDNRLAKTAAYTVVIGDRGKVIDATSGTWTLSLDAAATLGDGFSFAVFNSGSGVITLDPNGTEEIRDFAGSATTKSLAQGEGGILFCDGTGFSFLRVAAATSQTLISLGAIFNSRLAKTAAYTVVVGDKGKVIDATSGTWTLSLDPAATLGDAFVIGVFNSGSGVITIDPNGAETIRDAAGSATTKSLAQGEGGFLICDGTGFLFLKVATGGGTSTLTSLGAIFNSRVAKTGAYTVVVGDKGKVFDATSGTWTLSLDPAATLGDGFNCAVFNSGTGVITIDANGSETIKDVTSAAVTKSLAEGEACFLLCNGTGFLMMKFEPPGSGGSVTGLLLDIQNFLPSDTTESLTYASDLDTNGIIYRIQQLLGYGTYTNPHGVANGTTNFASGTGGGVIDYITNRAMGEFYTPNSANNWIAIDLGTNRTLDVNKYTVRTGNPSGSFAPRNWKLQGSNNVATNDAAGGAAATWVDLKVHVNDTSIPAVNDGTASFDVTPTGTGYRWLRLLTTGNNASGNLYLIIGELEFYGEFVYPAEDATPGFIYFDGADIVTRTNKTLASWSPKEGDSDIAGYPTYYVRNNRPVLQFLCNGSDRRVFFTKKMKDGARLTNGIRVIYHLMEAVTSGTYKLSSKFEKCSGFDLDTDNFGTEKDSATITCNATSGTPQTITVDHGPTEIDSIVAGDLFRLAVTMKNANVSAPATVMPELLWVEIQEL